MHSQTNVMITSLKWNSTEGLLALYVKPRQAVSPYSGPPAALLLLLFKGVLRLLQIFKTFASKSDLNQISISRYFNFGECIQINSDLNQTWSVELNYT